MNTLDHIEQQAVRLLADVRHIRATADQGKAPDADLLRQVRVNAAAIVAGAYPPVKATA